MKNKDLAKIVKKIEGIPQKKWRKLRENEFEEEHTIKAYEVYLNEGFSVRISQEQYTLSPHENCALRTNYRLDIYRGGREIDYFYEHENKKIAKLYKRIDKEVKPKIETKKERLDKLLNFTK